MKSFANVDIVGFYNRANLWVPYDDEYRIEYSDRTEYTAYAVQCREDMECGRGLTKENLQNTCLNDFAATISHRSLNSDVIDEKMKQKVSYTVCQYQSLAPDTVDHTQAYTIEYSSAYGPCN